MSSRPRHEPDCDIMQYCGGKDYPEWEERDDYTDADYCTCDCREKWERYRRYGDESLSENLFVED